MSEWPMQDIMFDLQDFYYNVLFLFEEQDNEWAHETLAYWHKYIHFKFDSRVPYLLHIIGISSLLMAGLAVQGSVPSFLPHLVTMTSSNWGTSVLTITDWLNLKRMWLRLLHWLRSCACILSCFTFVTHPLLWCSGVHPFYLLRVFFSFVTSPLTHCLYHVGQGWVALPLLTTVRRFLLY